MEPRFFNLHTHHNPGRTDVLALCNQYPDEFRQDVPCYSIGIHPWRIAADSVAEQLAFIETKLTEPNCLAVGECGLDKRIETPLATQIPVFEKQLALAEKYQKPVILHVVAAFDEVIAIKNKMNLSVPMVIHGFSKNIQVAQQLLREGFYLSFGKYLLRNPDLAPVFAQMPNERIFLETDTLEEGIETVYEVAAKAKGISVEALQQIIRQNVQTVFGRNIEFQS